jgi:hypothetical protein
MGATRKFADMGQNGALSISELSQVHHPHGIRAYLRKDAAIAWEAMRRASLSERGVDLYPLGPDSAYRTFAGQVRLKSFWRGQGQPQKAATPGTSNHGWGLAVDAGTGDKAAAQRMFDSINAIGHRFGWSHDEGARVGEPWHFRYVGGFKAPDPWATLTDRERRLARELIELRQVKHPTTAQLRRRRSVWRWLRDQRKRIFHEAQKTGWDKAHRKHRYQVLRGLTHAVD